MVIASVASLLALPTHTYEALVKLLLNLWECIIIGQTNCVLLILGFCMFVTIAALLIHQVRVSAEGGEEGGQACTKRREEARGQRGEAPTSSQRREACT